MPTNKDRLIRKLRQLPDELLEKLYFLDIINLKGKMQHNSWLADKYGAYQELSPAEGWLRFGVGEWIISMESSGN